jgi:hypothetical protein
VSQLSSLSQVQIKLITTVDAGRLADPKKKNRTSRPPKERDLFRSDFYGYSVVLFHYLDKINAPGFRVEVEKARASVEALKRQREEEFPEAGDVFDHHPGFVVPARRHAASGDAPPAAKRWKADGGGQAEEDVASAASQQY